MTDWMGSITPVRTVWHRKAIVALVVIVLVLGGASSSLAQWALAAAGWGWLSLGGSLLASLLTGALIATYWPVPLWHFEWTEDWGDGPKTIIYPYPDAKERVP